MPAIPSAPVDVVSIDYVADAIHALCEAEGGVGETYHLTAGPDASTIAEIAQLASRYFRRPLPTGRPTGGVRALDDAAPPSASALEPGAELLPVLRDRRPCSTSRDRGAPGAAGIAASPLGDYLERLLDFATRSRWGKRPIARVDALVA